MRKEFVAEYLILLNPTSAKPRNTGRMPPVAPINISPATSKRTPTAATFVSPKWSCKTPPIREAPNDTTPENPKASPARYVGNAKEKCRYKRIKGATAPYESDSKAVDRSINLSTVVRLCTGR